MENLGENYDQARREKNGKDRKDCIIKSLSNGFEENNLND